MGNTLGFIYSVSVMNLSIDSYNRAVCECWYGKCIVICYFVIDVPPVYLKVCVRSIGIMTLPFRVWMSFACLINFVKRTKLYFCLMYFLKRAMWLVHSSIFKCLIIGIVYVFILIHLIHLSQCLVLYGILYYPLYGLLYAFWILILVVL